MENLYTCRDTKNLIHHNEMQQRFLTVFQCFSVVLARSSLTVVKWGIFLAEWCSKACSYFLLAWLRREEQPQPARELYTSPSSAHTAFTTAATNPNWTWAIGTGSVDARCILKLERARWNPSQGCHFVMHYAYMQMPDKEMDYLKGHLWFPAQRYTQLGKWSEHSYHLVGAQLYAGVGKHSFRQFPNSTKRDDW